MIRRRNFLRRAGKIRLGMLPASGILSACRMKFSNLLPTGLFPPRIRVPAHCCWKAESTFGISAELSPPTGGKCGSGGCFGRGK